MDIVMAEARYTNRQIERLLDKQSEGIKSFMSDKIDPLTQQVTYTNGRVRWNEKMIYIAIGALIILTPITTWFFADYIKFKETFKSEIQSAVDISLDSYQAELIIE